MCLSILIGTSASTRNIKKYKFEYKETKYLDFIIQAGKGIKIDLEKTKECQDSFDLLKEKFITRPVLATFNLSYYIVVETDSSGYNTGGVLA
ncbi:uncharacterized protein ANIA_10653 [Aspergillus nidulans FGSC A4]|uniref:Reverse transcriptase/retrotransposon-derived protein RNase H-like domain-containing protein n=1 Tax=Emericella nidulans (strain FGSC A4 / ATCC 38163 / CBS 112.46 / NRRL 194 / M139) TaxID=227321 RepID=C8VFC2_EMENI|nr:hypothetical protein [Aspergillus nidulans FGSC A4]CBF81155.1 TPA: conserved hypothetical protein [Aspergillus nidulans FGSC A4]